MIDRETIPMSVVKHVTKKPVKIPFVNDHKLESLNPDMRQLAELTNGYFDSVTQQEFLHFLSDRSTRETMGEVSMYGGAMESATYYPGIGYYNPEEIPVSTFNKMRRHPQVAMGLALITLPVISLNYRVKSDSIEAKAYGNELLRPIYTPVVRDMCTAVPYGFYVGEMVLQRGPMKAYARNAQGKRSLVLDRSDLISIRKVKGIYPEQVIIDTDDKNNFKQVYQEHKYDKIPIPPERTFRFTLDEEFGNFFGRSRLKAAYKPWYQSEIMMQFMLRYFDRRGTPSVIVWAPPGMDVDPDTGETRDRLVVARDLGYSLLSNSVGVLPSTEYGTGNKKWDVNYLKDDQRGDMFINVLEVLFAQILRGMFIPEQLAGVGFDGKLEGGSNAADFFLLTEEALIVEIFKTLTSGILMPMLQMNSQEWYEIGAQVETERLMWSRRAILKDVFLQLMRSLNQGIRDGTMPKFMPDIMDVADALDIPMTDFNQIFRDDMVPQGEDPFDKDNPTKDKEVWKESKDNLPNHEPRKRAQKQDRNTRRRQQTPKRSKS